MQSFSRRCALVRFAGLLALAACALPSTAAALPGRWQRLPPGAGADTFVGDPLASLAQDVLEFRDQGVLADLLLTPPAGGADTVTTGRYALVDPAHLQITGRCWQGFASHSCAQTYRFTLTGDHLTLFGGPGTAGQLDYQRVGPAAAALPPTLAPPQPSAAP